MPLFCSIFFVFNLIAQPSSEKKHIELDVNEYFVIQFKLDSAVYKNKCNCFVKDEKKCKLVKGNVNKIIFFNSFFENLMSVEEIYKTNYILLPDTLCFDKGQIVTLSVCCKESKKYFIFAKNLNSIDLDKTIFHLPRAVYLTECYKTPFFWWLPRFIKLPENNRIKKDKFENYINNLN